MVYKGSIGLSLNSLNGVIQAIFYGSIIGLIKGILGV